MYFLQLLQFYHNYFTIFTLKAIKQTLPIFQIPLNQRSNNQTFKHFNIQASNHASFKHFNNGHCIMIVFLAFLT